MTNPNIEKATYSPEDNSLRIYPVERLDDETYKKVKEAGFVWAPIQGLFVSKMWTPEREDLCLELAGDIEPEETSLAERAEEKAMRLGGLATKREGQSSAYHAASNRLAERFAGGQPILVGHHSERKARRTQKQMHRLMEKSIEALNAVDYWNRRATGVERHANRKANPSVIANRIKTLLSDLREQQRALNHAYICFNLWTRIDEVEDTEKREKAARDYFGAQLKSGAASPYGIWNAVDKNEMSVDEGIEQCIDVSEKGMSSVYRARWIRHILNRLAYERGELGEVAEYEGSLTAAILQTFGRTHGVHSPTATFEDGSWVLRSTVPFPLHIGDGLELKLTDKEWIKLMQSIGYEVPAPKVRKASSKVNVPLLNPSVEDAEKLQALWNQRKAARCKERNETSVAVEVKTLSQATCSQHSKGNYAAISTIEIDEAGNEIHSTWRGGELIKTGVPVCRVRTFDVGFDFKKAKVLVRVGDKPGKPLPIVWPEEVTQQQVANA